MRAASMFSGIGGAELALPEADWQWCAEIEPFPSAVLAQRFGHPNLGDVLADDFIDRARSFGPLDLLCGGPPCFTAGHMVLLCTGYLPIEDVKPGDMAVTHEGRLRRVLRVGSKTAPVGHLRMVGNPDGVTCTPDHRLLARHWRNQSTKRNNAYVRIETIGEPDWICAKDMPNQQWLALNTFDVEAPEMPTGISPHDLMALAGWYLGDGWIRRHAGQKKREVVFGLCDAKVDKFAGRFPMVKHHVTNCRTCKKLNVSNTAIANWLEQHFGKLAHGKTVPAWAMSHPDRGQLLRGYLATDGTEKGNGDWTSNSVSRSLALGVAALAQTLGFSCSVNLVKTPDTTVIQGRTVNQRDYWQTRGFKLDRARKARTAENHLLRTCQSWEDAGEATVYDIEVEEDRSFILDGAIVHNCQAFSVAGNRLSMADPRGNLSLRFVQVAHAIRPRNLLVENVPGWLSTDDNAFGCFLGAIVGADGPLLPGICPRAGKSSDTWKWRKAGTAWMLRDVDEGGLPVFIESDQLGDFESHEIQSVELDSRHVPTWPSIGMAAGVGIRAAWRILDAQYAGLAQRRRRVFVVVDFGNGADPAAILFERQGLLGNTPPRREQSQRVTGTLSARTEGGGGLGTDFELGGGLVAIAMQAGMVRETVNSGPEGKGWQQDIAYTLEARAEVQAVAFAQNQRGELRISDISPQLTCGGEKPGEGYPAVAFDLRGRAGGAQFEGPHETASIRAADGGSSRSYVSETWAVRRLTVTECERLQGHPDGHTLIDFGSRRTVEPDMAEYLRAKGVVVEADNRTGKLRTSAAADGPRYKALGNAWAVACVRPIALNIWKGQHHG